jgi:hypothetical protein
MSSEIHLLLTNNGFRHRHHKDVGIDLYLHPSLGEDLIDSKRMIFMYQFAPGVMEGKVQFKNPDELRNHFSTR